VTGRVRDLVIVGTGGLGRMARQIVEDLDPPAFALAGFLDEDAARHGSELDGAPVLGGASWLAGRGGVAVVVAVGKPATRRRLVADLRRAGVARFPALVHPAALLSRRVRLGAGSIVYPGAIVDVDVEIGAHAVLNKHVTIGHDTVLGDFVTIAPGVNVGGDVRIGGGCDLGIGCATIQGVSIGPDSVVGAGAVVVGDLPAGVTAVGVPARPLA
jgi:sugar O-acyltransferase (sialic acid O-acetyltransferase NeuD family)